MGNRLYKGAPALKTSDDNLLYYYRKTYPLKTYTDYWLLKQQNEREDNIEDPSNL